VTPADPDGPAWLDAQVQAHCVLPSGHRGRDLLGAGLPDLRRRERPAPLGIVAPLLVHDLPVTVWWPGEPHFEGRSARELLPMADRVIVDGSGWSGDGLSGLVGMAGLPGRFDVDIADFAMIRQARWREAIASTFDRPGLLAYLGHIDHVEVRYAASDGTPAWPTWSGRCTTSRGSPRGWG
jgi:hypothetical protein